MESIQTPLARTPTVAVRSPRPILWWIGTFCGAVLGAVLLFAVWAKAIDPASFAEQIHTQKLDFLLPASGIALIALALETALGLALLLGVRKLWVLVPTALLIAFFLTLTGREWYLASHGLLAAGSSCGCFGNLVQRTPAQAFWQDLGLFLPLLLLACVGREHRPPRFPPVRTAAVVVATLAVVAFAWKAPALPLDDLATRLHPGVAVGAICAGEGAQKVCLDSLVPELAQGESLVVMTPLDAPELLKSVDALNALAGEAGGPDGSPALWVLTSATEQEQKAFFWKWGPRFQIREVPPELLRPLYRRLPRSFATRDGRVTRTFAGLPPLAAAPQSPGTRPAK
jgi:hypothetical protein